MCAEQQVKVYKFSKECVALLKESDLDALRIASEQV